MVIYERLAFLAHARNATGLFNLLRPTAVGASGWHSAHGQSPWSSAREYNFF